MWVLSSKGGHHSPEAILFIAHPPPPSPRTLRTLHTPLSSPPPPSQSHTSPISMDTLLLLQTSWGRVQQPEQCLEMHGEQVRSALQAPSSKLQAPRQCPDTSRRKPSLPGMTQLPHLPDLISSHSGGPHCHWYLPEGCLPSSLVPANSSNGP